LTARLPTEAAAQAYDTGRRRDMEAGMAKYFATEAALEAVRIHGAQRLLEGVPGRAAVPRRPAPLSGVGTNETQRIIIARQLVERNRI
jgi:alkylation response protein AidB-like acyl-CoA dehydrogenase